MLQRTGKELCSGRLLHADETKVSIKGKTAFVWVFANLEEVAYVYVKHARVTCFMLCSRTSRESWCPTSTRPTTEFAAPSRSA